jgi:hypothetical protein
VEVTRSTSWLKRTIPHALGTLLAAASLLVAALPSFAFSLWPYVLHPPSLYVIDGYLDRAPQDAMIRDRIEVTVHGRRRERRLQMAEGWCSGRCRMRISGSVTVRGR